MISVASLIRKTAWQVKFASLVQHAKEELKRAGLFRKDSDYNGGIGKAVMELIEAFSKQGHSGFSANWTLSVFDKVARFDILTPLSSKKTEWMEVCDGTWQSKRKSSVFSKDGGKTWYDIDDKSKKKKK